MSSRYQYYDRLERAAVERLDVLDEVPREQCQVRGCEKHGRYEWAGNWAIRWLCARHIPIYRQHDHILRRIRSL